MRETISLKVVDGLALAEEYRELLRPGEPALDSNGHAHVLPRFFYEIDSWQQAKETKLSPHFTLAELVSVDCKEADLLFHRFPHYVPCAVSLLARYLEAFRAKVENTVSISTNGGYRSPAHRAAEHANPHNWATGANIFRVGDTLVDSQSTIEKYARIAETLAPEVYAKPFGYGRDETDDHLHIDIGYVSYVPRECNEAR